MPSGDPFVHLHVHTDHSLLDGAAKIPDVVRFAAEDGAPAIATTDHGTPSAVIELHQAASKAGITAIPGVEAYHVPDVTKSKTYSYGGGNGESEKKRHHLLLLGVTTEGYRNIMRMSSRAWLDHYHYQPLLDDAILAEHAEGVVATSGCLGSQFNQALLKGDEAFAKEVLGRHKDIFGERFFIEVQDHNIPDQTRITPAHLRLSKEMGIPLVATNDSHYMTAEDAAMHDALLCMGTKALLSDTDRFRFSSDQNYMKSAREMRALFPDDTFPGACDNTLLIAEMAQGIQIVTPGQYLIPQFPIDTGETAQAMLRRLVYEGARELYGVDDDNNPPDDVVKQIEFELGVIHDMGFDDYMLITADLVQEAKRRGYQVGPGRGSAAGSIITYTTRITTIDPLQYGLYFERFLNPGRRSMPDIDVDFDPDCLHEMKMYAADKYGADRVAAIANYGTYKGKSSLKAANRVLGNPVATGDRLSAMYIDVVDQVKNSLAEVMREDGPSSEKMTDCWRSGHLLRDAYKRSDTDAEIIDLALGVEGIKSQRGIHASGVLVTPGPLTDYVPVVRAREEGSLPVTAYDLHGVEAIGGLKIDFLGLSNLSIIRRTVNLIKRDVGRDVDVDNLPLDDPKVYKMLSEGDTDGIFQLEGSGMRDLLIRLQPTRFEDIAACVALYRPGPMGTKMHHDYADRKNGRKKRAAIHPDMHEMFDETYSLMIYQEQLIALSQHFAGFDATQADLFRKATGKKDPVLLAEQEGIFKEGVVSRGYGEQVANDLWAMIPPFAAYSFNKAHAVAYGMISYQTAWLKVNYPAQYAAACIDFMDRDKRSVQVEAARSRGVQVFSPDINKSDISSTTNHGSIWLGVGGISNCGGITMTAVLRERRNGAFTSLADFLVRMSGKGINKKSARSLVLAGCFDGLHPSRRAMVDNIEDMVETAKRIASSEVDEDESDLFADLDEEIGGAMEEFVLTGPDYGVSERIALEIETLGFIAGTHPYSMVESVIPSAIKAGIIPVDGVEVGHPSIREGQRSTVYGTLQDVRTSQTRQGREMTRFVLETGRGPRIDVILVGRKLHNSRAGSFAYVTGSVRVDGDDDTSKFVIMADDARVVDLDALLASPGAEPKRAPVAREVPVVSPPRQRRDEAERTDRRSGRERRIDDLDVREERRSTPDRRVRDADEARSAAPAELTVEDAPTPTRASDEPRRRRTPTGPATFRVTDEAQLNSLANLLRKMVAGGQEVVVIYQGAEVPLPGLKLDLTPEDISRIERETGVSVVPGT